MHTEEKQIAAPRKLPIMIDLPTPPDQSAALESPESESAEQLPKTHPPADKAPDKLADKAPNAQKDWAALSNQADQLRRELAMTYRTRDALGESLQKLFTSRVWTWGPVGFLLARAAGLLKITGERLIPLGDLHRGDNGTWSGIGPAQFLVPIVPMKGWARLRVTLHASVSSRACLYFDTGHAFHQKEHLELGPVAGDTVIDRMVALRKTAYLLRFDPIQHSGQFELKSFSLEPMSRLWFNSSAVLGNLIKTITGRGAHRPSILVGLKLLFTGQIKKFHSQLVCNVESTTAVSEYELWRKRHEITDADRLRMRQVIAGWETPPLISVILPVYNVPEVYLRACIDSVIHQIYQNWELCIADDASPKPHVKKVLAEYAARDPRIKVVYLPTNSNISAASNAALKLATGEHVALLDHDDELSEQALFAMAEALVNDPQLDMIYSDEDKLSPAGKHVDPFFKPDWSPEYFMACMYTCHLGVYRTELIRSLGGWRSEFDGAQDYDLVLRIISQTTKILHIPDILYHWRVLPTSTASHSSAKPEAYGRAGKALESHLARLGRKGRVEDGPSIGFHRVRYEIQGNPLVSIVIPSACKRVQLRGRETWFVLECVSSIRKRSSYTNLEIIVLDNDDISDELLAELRPYDIRLIPFKEPFNLARKMNLGAFSAKGEQLIILNDDIEVISKDWIQSMLEFSQWPEIGAVGAQLLFPDGTQQHNGVTVLEGNPGHPFYQFPGEHQGYFLSSQVHRNWSAVTGACMMTRADVFKSVGGFSEKFPVNYNDVDYCLKVLKAGHRVVHMPYAKLYHHESVSVKRTGEHELTAFKDEWLKALPRDPYYNPNLSMNACDFRIG
jgi:GT2 family glycosyltransferase